ncbi:MAG: proline dehydrogenase family protein, partial [Microbacterium sp.]
LPALNRLTEWATERVDGGGAPIKVRLVKGANLAMEQVDAVMHGWPRAPYDTKVDTDANYLRCLDAALTPERTRAVRLGIAGHNLFDIAYAWLLAEERGALRQAQEPRAVEFEMLLGMAEDQVRAVSRVVGTVLLYVPVVHPDEFDAAVSYLVRRLEENASSENFLSAAFALNEDAALFTREENRFRASVHRASDPTLVIGPRRRPQRGVVVAPEEAREGQTADEDQLTAVVSGFRGADAPALFDALVTPDESFVSTAVFKVHETTALAAGAPGFRNAADTDPAVAGNRAWARAILDRVPSSEVGEATIRAARIDDADALDAVIEQVRQAADGWGSTPASERGEVLRRAAAALEERRAELIEVAASETGKVLPEADTEVSEAVDFANYYASLAAELDSVAGAVFVPVAATVVAPPWNFPIAIPAGGVLAALAAGSGVVFKPAPQAGRCAAVVAEALWSAGVPRELLALIDIDEQALGQRLITHEGVDRVILTGSFETAALFRSWRPELPILAETSGKNAIIVTPSADLDLAASDIVHSAFSHAGQKCSAASLVILVGQVARSKRFARQLVDATTSLRVGPSDDPRSEVGPLIGEPTERQAWALGELGEGEQWLVTPTQIEERYWTPGIRIGVREGSRFHREEFFCPVLGVMHAPTLERAIAIQNAVDYGLTAGIHTRDPRELEQWLGEVQAGNLYVNRGTTGAIVQRQPFGGWKRSSVGTGAKAGGPNHLVGLGSWRAVQSVSSGSQQLRGLDTRIAAVVEAGQAALGRDEFAWLRRGALSDAANWNREFGAVKDVSQLGVERNLFRYRAAQVAVRGTAGAPLHEVLRVVVAAVRASEWFSLSVASGLPAPVRRVLSDLDVPVHVESDDEWVQRMSAHPSTGPSTSSGQATGTETVEDETVGQFVWSPQGRPPRARLIGPSDERTMLAAALAVATDGSPDIAVYQNDVTTAGRLELLPFLREQSISITAHRFGNPDPTFNAVI